MTAKSVEMYCFHCRTKRLVDDPEPFTTRNGREAQRGKCSVCGANLTRMGSPKS